MFKRKTIALILMLIMLTPALVFYSGYQEINSDQLNVIIVDAEELKNDDFNSLFLEFYKDKKITNFERNELFQLKSEIKLNQVKSELDIERIGHGKDK